MALSQQSKEKAEQELKNIFPGEKINFTGHKADGGVEYLSINANGINKQQLVKLAELAVSIPNSFFIKRSGTRLSIGFF
jgi:hypothetical protein